jgi:hypothetical protein
VACLLLARIAHVGKIARTERVRRESSCDGSAILRSDPGRGLRRNFVVTKSRSFRRIQRRCTRRLQPLQVKRVMFELVHSRRWPHEQFGGGCVWFFWTNANDNDRPSGRRGLDQRRSMNGLRRKSQRNSMAERDQILAFDVASSKVQAAHDVTNS